MKKSKNQKYPLVWQEENFGIKIFCSIPNIATGIIISTTDDYFLVDPGDGILRDLNTELSPTQIINISDIFISHGHHDHIGGIWSLLTYLSVMKREKDLNIFYPDGCKEIETIVSAFHEVYLSELTYQINLKSISNQRTFTRNSIKIKPFKVNHRELIDDNKTILVPALGFKFTYDGKNICYGGDTAYCESLVKMSENSDLAIIEAGAEDDIESELHMTISQAEQIGKTAKKYFLVHVPQK